MDKLKITSKITRWIFENNKNTYQAIYSSDEDCWSIYRIEDNDSALFDAPEDLVNEIISIIKESKPDDFNNKTTINLRVYENEKMSIKEKQLSVS